MKVSDQFAQALRGLHPGVRKDIRRALADVDAGKRRDVAGLTGRLLGFSRLRVGKCRIIIRYDDAGELIAELLGVRDSVYESFSSSPPSGV